MKEVKIIDGISFIGGIDHDLRVFDITMHTEFGTSYNSYIVEGSEKTALIETVKHTFTDRYIEFLNNNKDLTKIDYIVVNHTEPDHVGTIGKLLEYTPNAVVLGSAAAIRFLGQIANKPFNSIIVREDDEISLGDKTLKFIMAPFLHWPDTIYTYIPEDKLIFTCDSFGAHYAFDGVFSSKIINKEDYMKALKYYFDMIMGPFKNHMLNAIRKIENLEIEYICNGHGPILDDKPMEIVKLSKKWASNQEKVKQIIIPYVSAYGYSKQLAETIAEGIKSQDNYAVKLYDMVYADEVEVIEEITKAEGVIFGSPTINGDALLPIMNILVKLSPIVHGGMFAAAFGSYGWSGEAVSNLSRRMKELKFKVLEGFKVNFKPSDKDLEAAFEFGVKFIKVMIKEDVFVAFDAPKNLTHRVKNDNEETIKKWICTVCQEVFSGKEPPEICAACGASKEQFEEYFEEIIKSTKEIEEQIVIIGNGIAGVTVAETLRKYSENAKITIIDKCWEPVYYKPMLSKFIGQDEMPNTFYLHDHKWYETNNIKFIAPVVMDIIDTKIKEIKLNTGDVIAYDKLVIASGSESFMPPIKNNNLKGVVTLRTYKDAIKIKNFMKQSKKAVIIGGGLLGLESAAEMQRGGLEVTIVEIMDRLLPRQLDIKGSSILEEGFNAKGITIIKDAKVESIIKNSKKTDGLQVAGVKLEDGTLLEADIVLVSAGVRSDLRPYKAIGISCDRGINVNKKMETNIKDIYACGDCACFNGLNYSIWPEAVIQGKATAYSILGIEKIYEKFIPSTICNALGLEIFSIGELNYDNNDSKYSHVIYENKEKNQYKLMIFKDQQLVGGIIIGDNKKSKLLIKGIKSGQKLTELIEVFS